MAKFNWVGSILGLLVAGCLVLGMVHGMLQGPAPLDDLGVFVEKLLLEHNYLLPEDLRQEFDELHRELRILEAPRNPPRVSRRRLARAKIRAATGKLLGSLEQNFIDVSLDSARSSVASDSSVLLPGDIGAILLRVNAALKDPRYVVRDFDLSRHKLPVKIEIAPDSTNWILVHLTNVPPGATTVTLDLVETNSKTTQLALRVQRPDPGRLRVRIVDAGTGNIVPAMVNLVWQVNGKEKKPAGTIELADQFDSQGWSTGRRHTNLPGKLEGRFWWVVPEPFDMELSPGPWEITIRKGLEYVPVSQSVMIEPRKATEVTLKLSRWVEMSRQGWYSGDDHVHARIQSDDDAEDLMSWLQAEDLRLANIVEMGDIFRTYFQQRGFGERHRYEEQGHVLSPGQECPRTFQLGHTLSMDTTTMVRYPDQYFLYDLVFDQVHEQGGLSGYAHADTGAFHLHRDMSLNVTRGKIDFFEILQFGRLGTDLYYDFLNLGFKVIASAGSDVPWGGTVGEVRVYAYTGETQFSADRWMDAFRKGRTFVTDGPIIDFCVDEALPGDEVRIDRADRRLKVVARTYRDPRLGSPSLLQVISQGEVIKEAHSDDPAKQELDLSLDVKGGDGFWIAARAEARDGTYAHTTPVYVVRRDMRFWRYQQIPKLIRQRRQSLQEIEKIVSVADHLSNHLEDASATLTSEDLDAARAIWPRALNREGKVTIPYVVQQLARQGPELLERVRKAQKIYDDLLKTWHREASFRQKPE